MTPAPAPAVAGRSTWSGLQDNDTWQNEFFGPEKQRELHFWFGEPTSVADASTTASGGPPPA